MGLISREENNSFEIHGNGTGTLSSQDFTLSTSGVYVIGFHISGVSDCNTVGVWGHSRFEGLGSLLMSGGAVSGSVTITSSTGAYAPTAMAIASGTSSGQFKITLTNASGWSFRCKVSFSVIDKSSLNTNKFITE